MSSADPAQNSFSYLLHVAKDVLQRRPQKPIGPESKIKVPRPRVKVVAHYSSQAPCQRRCGTLKFPGLACQRRSGTLQFPGPVSKKVWHIKVLRPRVKEGVAH